LTVTPEVLDELLAMLKGPAQTAPAQLFLCFDDGYADAAAYVAKRAPLNPSVRWLFFVCPEKIERRAGFRGDLFELTATVPTDRVALENFLPNNFDILGENQRSELQRLGNHENFALATAIECARLGSLENVTLGNHTNCHFRLTELTSAAAEQELRTSIEAFERLFGPCRHIAFPFGAPDDDFTPGHVAFATSLRQLLCWSTEQRPFRPDELTSGAVLPRFTLYQFPNTKAMITKICLLSTFFRLRERLGGLLGTLDSRLAGRGSLRSHRE